MSCAASPCAVPSIGSSSATTAAAAAAAAARRAPSLTASVAPCRHVQHHNLAFPSLLHAHAAPGFRGRTKNESSHPVLGAWRRTKVSPPVSCTTLRMDPELLHDLAMGVATGVAAFGSLTFWEVLAKKNVFEKKVSRKLVHISIGLVFMLFWPLFGNGNVAPYIAAFAPVINTLRILAIGSGLLVDDAVVKSMTRDGDPKELIKGPFYYGTTIALVTICLWRSSPLAPVVIANLCAGDGFADLIGRRFGSSKLPYNVNKSYVGSLAMFTFGTFFSFLYQLYFSSFGFYALSFKMVAATMIVTFVTTIVESLPISTRLDDNLTVPFTSFVVGSFLF